MEDLLEAPPLEALRPNFYHKINMKGIGQPLPEARGKAVQLFRRGKEDVQLRGARQGGDDLVYFS